MRTTSLLLSLTVWAPALAAPLHAGSGQTIRVRVGTRSEPGIGLKPSPTDGAWRLIVRGARAPHAEVIDVTADAPPNKWIVDVVARAGEAALVFDTSRFVAGHAYRVVLRDEEALVYLYAPTRARASHVVFGDAPLADDPTDGIAITPKSAL